MPSNSIASYAKAGFGLGLGAFAAQIVFLGLGLLLFLPGLSMVRNHKEDTKGMSYYTGIVLMILGVVLMGGFGLGMLLENMDI